MTNKFLAEYIGTLWLIIGGCGSAMISANYPELGIGVLGVSLAFGLSVLTMVYSIGPISGSHLNPAITIGLWVSGKFEGKDVPYYVLAQLLGAISGAALLYVILLGKPDVVIGSFAANGYGELSPGKYELPSAFLIEVIMSFMLIFIVLGATCELAPKGISGLSIGLGVTLIHLISIPITNTSVNPARSTSQAIFSETAAMEQLWLFWVAPLIGAIIAGLMFKILSMEIPE
ncbi:aquaporin Z [Lishizhenia sp.]|uniref:aquaporin Z n=1 Tax=Lishizhenia sp. TaxID=2497594 RepID=UPI00299EECC1|nr:aquaporin Z [Lishizhenia sp.]MDX1446645.1 aquaporin Z [Lishizhenia sp.]